MTKQEKQVTIIGLLLLLLWMLLRKKPTELVTSRLLPNTAGTSLDSGNPLWGIGSYGQPGWGGLTR